MSNVSSFHTTPASLSRYPHPLSSLLHHHVFSIPPTVWSYQCSETQRSVADHNVVFRDGDFKFHDSWTCHIQNCTTRQRVVQCNTQRASCMNNWYFFKLFLSIGFDSGSLDINLSIYRIIRLQITSTPQVVSAVRLWRHRFTV